VEVVIRHSYKFVRDSHLRLQLLNAFDAILQLQSFERIFKACVHIDVDLPEAMSLAKARSSNMMRSLSICSNDLQEHCQMQAVSSS
jgi:hypothetical protein